jgi:squalene-hopene/tetraprenyl-beta-curcumene cyclase
MHTTDLIHRPTVDWPARPASEPTKLAPSYHELVSPVRNAILRARRILEFAQRPDGSWLAAKCGVSSLSSQLLFLLTFLDDEASEIAEQAAAALRTDQREDGTWSRVANGPSDVSASVAAYFALKLVGDEPTAPHMRTARQAIRALGGADAVDNATRLWLALFGQIDFAGCEPIAPEWLLLPKRWQDRVLGALPADERRKRTAQSIVWALRPAQRVDMKRGVRELFVQSPEVWPAASDRCTCWQGWWNCMSLGCERAGFVPIRNRALEVAEAHLARDAAACEVLELSFEEVVWQMVALHATGYARESAECVACDARLKCLLVEDADLAVRPARTTDSLADTELALRSLASSGVESTRPLVANGAAWLIDRLSGSNAPTNAIAVGALASRLRAVYELLRESEPDGTLPPDIQMTRDRMARFLARHRDRELPQEALESLASGARDALLERLSLAASAEELGSAIEALAEHGLPATHRSITFGATMLRTLQQADGSWSDAARQPSIESTAAAIRGLLAAGEDAKSDAVAAGINWLLVEQNSAGIWGDVEETTAAILALVAAGNADREATRRAIDVVIDACQIVDEGQAVDVNTISSVMFTLSRWLVAAAAVHAEPTPTRLRLVGELSLVN